MIQIDEHIFQMGDDSLFRFDDRQPYWRPVVVQMLYVWKTWQDIGDLIG